MRHYDYLIVGAGFAGSVMAERLAADGKTILLVEQRDHVGGNAYDYYDENGLLIHKYGPHIFHTNSDEVFSYLSQFTSWRPYEHRVLASVEGKLLPIPINLDTINGLYGLTLRANEIEQFYASRAEQVKEIRTSEDVIVSKVGRDLYEKFYVGYTRKQWGMDPSELDSTVAGRVPIRTNQDDRYFTDTYQMMPLEGYSRLFDRMLASPRIDIMLDTDYRDVANFVDFDRMIFTGPIDLFFDYRLGRLPYRSLDFDVQTLGQSRFQQTGTINYPNEHDYTRITEFKHVTGQRHALTAVCYEYPRATGDPYYPVPRPENAVLYQRYKELADATPDVFFVGRLATYKYYNMDQVVAQALALHERLLSLPLPRRRTYNRRDAASNREEQVA